MIQVVSQQETHLELFLRKMQIVISSQPLKCDNTDASLDYTSESVEYLWELDCWSKETNTFEIRPLGLLIYNE